MLKIYIGNKIITARKIPKKLYHIQSIKSSNPPIQGECFNQNYENPRIYNLLMNTKKV